MGVGPVRKFATDRGRLSEESDGVGGEQRREVSAVEKATTHLVPSPISSGLETDYEDDSEKQVKSYQKRTFKSIHRRNK